MILSNLPVIVIALAAITLFYRLDKKHGLLRDSSSAKNRPYSFGRVQLAWWTLIVFIGMIYVAVNTYTIPNVTTSILLLLGMSIGTTYAAKLSDNKDKGDFRHQDGESQGLFIDVISNDGGVSLPRLQSLMFNFAFGIYAIYCFVGLKQMPDISTENIVLLGISSAGYLASKTTENIKKD